MNWSNWAAFWDMGGHGLYVWGSFGVTALVLLGELLLIGARRRALQRELPWPTDGASKDEA